MRALNIHEIPEYIKGVLSEDEINSIIKSSSKITDLAYNLIEIEEYVNAYDLFSFSYQIDGYSPDLLNGLAVIFSEQEDTVSALKILKKAVQLYPKDAVTLANAATLYWENNDYAKAIYYYNKAITINNTLLDAHINLINLYYESGDIYLAFITCLSVLKIFPNDRQLLELQNEILLDMAMSCC